MFYKKGVSKNFAKLTPVPGSSITACSLIKKETVVQVLSCEFCKIFNNNVFHRTARVTVRQCIYDRLGLKPGLL